MSEEESRKIETGEFVRTFKGKIGRIINIANNFYYLDNMIAITEKSIVNHSRDIKDLIEIGDYINGCKVVEFFRDDLTEITVIKTANQRKYYNSKIIKSIVTKEQFENAEYRIPEEK